MEKKIEKINNEEYEKALYEKGFKSLCGVDEAGRGPLVGPVVAAAIILPKGYKLKDLKDSKELSEGKRRVLARILKKDAIAYSYGIVDNKTIDEINIFKSTKKAMKIAIKSLKIKPDFVLIDAVDLKIKNSLFIIKGDKLSKTISAASILAKCKRDELMYELDRVYPIFDYKNNKGYPTKKHIELLEKYGKTKHYRESYAPVRKVNKIYEKK